jgi:hypothetical protein
MRASVSGTVSVTTDTSARLSVTVRVTLRLTVSQSVSQSVLVSSPLRDSWPEVAPTLWGPSERASLPPPPFYLKTEAEPASETFLNKKHLTMDTVQKQYSSKCITPSSEPFRIDLTLYPDYTQFLRPLSSVKSSCNTQVLTALKPLLPNVRSVTIIKEALARNWLLNEYDPTSE